MTAGVLMRARDGRADATMAATALWEAIVGRVDADAAGAALDLICTHLGKLADVPDAVLREAVVRTASYLANSGHLLGYHGGLGEGLPEADPRVGGYSALRRSGAMGLLAPWVTRRAGAI